MSLNKLHIVMMVVACLLAVLLFLATARTMTAYSDLATATEKYIACRQDASDMQEGSDYLTDKVRSFAVTGDLEYVRKFDEEVNVTKRRDRAIENLEAFLAGTDTYEYLREALRLSNELIEREYLSIRLGAEAYGLDLAAFPEAIRTVRLPEQYRGMDAEELRENSISLLFDEVYQDYKNRIRENVSKCTVELIETTQGEQVLTSKNLLQLLRRQRIFILLLLVCEIAAILLTIFLAIRPLRAGIRAIRNKETFPVTGAEEIRYLAEAYNHAFEESQRSHEQLSYEAAHDPLTGLYNRSMFDKIREENDADGTALIIVDVDYFKSVNDTYGHEMGDRVLKKMARVLTAAFRSEDCICRIGGDEFVVFMRNAGKELTGLVRGKYERIRDQLGDDSDGIVGVTISVGVAFPDRENPTGDLYKDADAALYRVKDAGRNGCAFY